jgi:hypothetical protein
MRAKLSEITGAIPNPEFRSEILHNRQDGMTILETSLQIITAFQMFERLMMNAGNFDKWFLNFLNLPGPYPG